MKGILLPNPICTVGIDTAATIRYWLYGRHINRWWWSNIDDISIPDQYVDEFMQYFDL